MFVKHSHRHSVRSGGCNRGINLNVNGHANGNDYIYDCYFNVHYVTSVAQDYNHDEPFLINL